MSDETEKTTASSQDEADGADGSAVVDDRPGFDALLEHLHRARGFDFSGYKEASLARRIKRRMQAVAVPTFPEYVDFLQVHPDEFPQLFNTVLINVTSFFRDRDAWDALAAHVPKLLAERKRDESIRAWSAGCASGEEPFTLAMMLAEAMGFDEYTKRVKIYATDVDEDALSHARQAQFTAKAVEGVPPALLEKYFVPSGSMYALNKELRRSVIFGRHDLAHDAPISRVDILTCRNTLMYFNAEAQSRILNRLQFALRPDGILFLGKAEMLLTHPHLFAPVDLKLRLFARASRSVRSRERVATDPAAMFERGAAERAEPAPEKSPRLRLLQAAFDTAPYAVMVVDAQGRLALANKVAHHTLGVLERDIGRPFQDLEVSYRPVELRSYIDVARADRRPKHVRDIECVINGDVTWLDITVTPLFGDALDVLAVQIAFIDVTHHRRLQTELRRTNTELEAAHEELQSTSEELETTNEELQSTVEELETTNEELQSTNEELETMNEELQSSNEELQTMNDELRQRGDELNRVNASFGAVLRTLDAGVAVLDDDLRVQAWNEKMEDLWGLRADEVEGKHFVNLDIGLPVADLAAPIRACLAGESEVKKTVSSTNRRGRAITIDVFVTRLTNAGAHGVIVRIEEVASPT